MAQAKSLYQVLTFDTVLRQMSAKNSAVLAELDADGTLSALSVKYFGTDISKMS